MTALTHSGFPSSAATPAARPLDASRVLATLLLASVVAAVLVVAQQVIDAWSEGHLLAGWIALWTVAFAALALLASPSLRLTRQVRAVWASQAERRRAAAQDRQMWELAQADPRVMADLRWALSRDAV